MEARSHHHEHDHQRAEITVNGRSIRLADREPIGSQVLAEAGFEPVDEHVLIQRVKIGSRLISLDQRVDLRGACVERF